MPRTIVMSCGDADASGAAPGSPVGVLPIGSLLVELDFVAGPGPGDEAQVGLHVGRVKKFCPGGWILSRRDAHKRAMTRADRIVTRSPQHARAVSSDGIRAAVPSRSGAGPCAGRPG